MSSAVNSNNNNNNRRKNDDSAYYAYTSYHHPPHNTNNMSTVSAANKRRRVDAKKDVPAYSTGGGNGNGLGGAQGQEEYVSAVDMSKMPFDVLHRYLEQHDLVPAIGTILPSPMTAQDPPPPSTLFTRRAGPPPGQTSSTRRSTRGETNEEAEARVPVMADVEETRRVMAAVVASHFEAAHATSEGEVLASFMSAVQARQTSA